jgi:hypothetical protein
MEQRRQRSSEPSIADLEPGLRIDEHGLEDESCEQSDKYYVVAKQLALTISRKDFLKKKLEETKARAAEKVRREAEVADERMTDAICKERVVLDREVREDTDALLKAELDVGLWFALNNAFIQRNEALERLVKLHVAGYYGGAAIERAGRGRQREESERNREAIAEMYRNRKERR